MTAKQTPGKRRWGLGAKTEAFFERNPGEELTMNDLIDKFGVKHPRTAAYRIKTAIADGAQLEIVTVVRRKVIS